MEFTSIKIKKDPLCPLILAKRDSFGEINLSSSQPTLLHVGPLYGERLRGVISFIGTKECRLRL